MGILAKLLKELETRRETFQRLGVGSGVVGVWLCLSVDPFGEHSVCDVIFASV